MTGPGRRSRDGPRGAGRSGAGGRLGLRSRNRRRERARDRGQAYTLEAFIGAILLLTAVLFMTQSIVITPTTGGAADRGLLAGLGQEAQDALVVSEEDDELSELVRYWNVTEVDGEEEVVYHNQSHVAGMWYNTSDFGDAETMNVHVGEILNERFTTRGQSYNVQLHFYNDSAEEYEFQNLVFQGAPDSNAFTASYTVTLYDDQNLTAPGHEDRTLRDVDEDEAIIPNAFDEPIYNVVEVRVVIW